MAFDPTDFTTWTAFADHPVFGDTKFNIGDWSLNPSLYSDIKNYGRFMPEWYVHVDPAPPVAEQRELADRDITNLAAACSQIKQALGHIEYELVILDDFTVFVWVRHSRVAIDIYPNNFPDEDGIFTMIIDSPDVEASEHVCPSVENLIGILRQIIGT